MSGNKQDAALIDYGNTGNELISIEWKDYYTVDKCQNPAANDLPRAVREITVRWDDGGAENRQATRTILGPRISPSWGWTAEFDASTSLSLGDYKQEQWNYLLAGTGGTNTQPVWSTMHVTRVGAVSGECTVIVGPIGQLARASNPVSVCKLKQGYNIFSSSC